MLWHHLKPNAGEIGSHGVVLFSSSPSQGETLRFYINERKTQGCTYVIGTQGSLYPRCVLDHGHLVYGSKICPRSCCACWEGSCPAWHDCSVIGTRAEPTVPNQGQGVTMVVVLWLSQWPTASGQRGQVISTARPDC